MSTRMIGGVVMTHGDDKGLVLPPGLGATACRKTSSGFPNGR
jgi:prolyl-tRNA synthetase